MINNITILSFQYNISSLNETALLVSFENCIDIGINEKVLALHQLFAQKSFNGFIETVPAYNSLAVFYNVTEIKNNNTSYTTAYDFVKSFTELLLAELNSNPSFIINKTITIPVLYNGEDLASVAEQHQLSIEDVISIHTAKPYRVFMVGFLPGFPYLGKLDDRIATPRLAAPRLNVKAGSVGIAGFQTGIYPSESPGGWQLIGQTPIKIFDKEKNIPCLLSAGDNVQFISISKADFETLYEY